MKRNGHHPIEDNPQLMQPMGFAYNASGEEAAMASTMADVRLAFPYPPKNCEHALAIIQSINDAIKDTNEKIAAGATDRVGKRYLTAYITVLAEFKQFVNNSNCIKQAMDTADAEFNTELQDALNKENTASSSKKTMDNILIFGAIGLFVTGALLIIFKKKKS